MPAHANANCHHDAYANTDRNVVSDADHNTDSDADHNANADSYTDTDRNAGSDCDAVLFYLFAHDTDAMRICVLPLPELGMRADWYSHKYYAISPAANPPWSAPQAYHACRGGSWNSEAEMVRTAARGNADPGQRDGLVSIRCAR